MRALRWLRQLGMSFQASARVVRDASRPLGLRVLAFSQCIGVFSPFGFTASREQLRTINGVTGGQWTEKQLLHGLDLLEQARRSWSAARDGADVHTYQPENRYHRPLPDNGVSFGVWLAAWLGQDSNAERWGVAHLGMCPNCAHLLVLHGQPGCWGCVTDMGLDHSRSCRVPSPLVGPEGARNGASPKRPTGWFRSLLRGRGGRRRGKTLAP